MNRFLLLSLLTLLTYTGFSQTLKPTDELALMNVVVTDFQEKPLPNEIVVFTDLTSKKSVSRKTNQEGKFQILLPKGKTYSVSYKSFIEEKEHTKLEVPNQEGLMEGVLTVQMESVLEQTFELDILFETGKSTIKPGSFASLNEVVEAMKQKPLMKIEVAGHTDNVGEETANQKLSESRAASVKNYLAKKGIASSRITSKGFGESKPVASNDSEEGRAKNRRTEIRVLSL